MRRSIPTRNRKARSPESHSKARAFTRTTTRSTDSTERPRLRRRSCSRARLRSVRLQSVASPKSCLADGAGFLPEPVRPHVGDLEALPQDVPKRWRVTLGRVLGGFDAEPAHACLVRVVDPSCDEGALG